MANHSAGPANHPPPGAGDAAEPDAGAVSPAALGPAPRRRARRIAQLFSGGPGSSGTPPGPPSCPHCGHTPPAPTPPAPPQIVGADEAPLFLRALTRKTVWRVGDPAPTFKPMFSDVHGRPWRYDRDLLRWICEAPNGLIVDSSPDYYDLVARLGPLTLR